jgi:hypothetical protein
LRTAAGLQQKLVQYMLTQALEEVATWKAGDESPEMFVRRENIARYRSLLKSRSLSYHQRRAIKRLLRDEEEKMRR